MAVVNRTLLVKRVIAANAENRSLQVHALIRFLRADRPITGIEEEPHMIEISGIIL